MPATVALSAAISSFCSELSCKEKKVADKKLKRSQKFWIGSQNSEIGIALTQVNFGTIIKEKLM